MPSDIVELTRTDASVRPEVRRFLSSAEQELEELIGALGGRDHVTPQRLLLAQDAARLSVVIAALFVRFAQTGDEETAARIGTLIAARRAQLRELGLERFEREVNLSDYLAQRAADRQEPAGSTNGEPIEAQVVEGNDPGAGAGDRREEC